jgi:hypothetical protein
MHLHRRTFLRGSGAAVALPFLEALAPTWPRPRGVARAAQAAAAPPKRMLLIMSNMGVIPRNFFPDTPGRDYESTPYLDILKAHRDRFTVFSGLSHPDVGGAHATEKSFLNAAPHPGRSTFRNTISMDQFAVERTATVTRFPSLALIVGYNTGGMPSTTRDGVQIPPERDPAALYRKLFVQGTPEEVEQRVDELGRGASILDFVLDDARRLERHLPSRDRQRLEQYCNSVRELEVRLGQSREWERKPKPAVDLQLPRTLPDDSEIQAQTDLMYDITRLALETDATRIVSIFLAPLRVKPKLPGITGETHGLTHHGGDPTKLALLQTVEEIVFGSFARLLDGLAGAPEAGGTLLDNTAVLFGSNLSNANSHDTTNLPIILAGGGFRHGQHLAFDKKNNMPLANLFVSMLQDYGLEVDAFASSTGTLTGLERA